MHVHQRRRIGAHGLQMKASARGWFRVWTVITVASGVACAAIAWSQYGDYRDADSDCHTQYRTPARLIPRSDLPPHLAIEEEEARRRGWDENDISLYMGRIDFVERVKIAQDLRKACADKQRDNARKAIYTSIGIWMGIAVGLYLCGWSIGWIWRGFFPKNA